MSIKRKSDVLEDHHEGGMEMMPHDCLRSIFSFLEKDTLTVCSFVCKRWNSMVTGDIFTLNPRASIFMKNATPNLVKWLRDNECPPDRDLYAKAIEFNVEKGMEWGKEYCTKNGIDSEEIRFNVAALNNDYETLAKIRRNSGSLSFVSIELAKKGNYNMIFWLEREKISHAGHYLYKISKIPNFSLSRNEEAEMREWMEKMGDAPDKEMLDTFLDQRLLQLTPITDFLQHHGCNISGTSQERRLHVLVAGYMMLFGDFESLSLLKIRGYNFTPEVCSLPLEDRISSAEMWAKVNSFEIDVDVLCLFAKRGIREVARILYTVLCRSVNMHYQMGKIANSVVSGGHLQTITDFSNTNRDQVFLWEECNLEKIAKNLRVAELIANGGFGWNSAVQVIVFAIRNNNMQLLQKLWSFPHSRKIMHYALKYGRTEMIEWLWSKGMRKDKEVMDRAVEYASLEIVQWVREKGCPWDEITVDYAILRGEFKNFQWLVENGCPWNKTGLLTALAKGNFAMARYMKERGGSIDVDEYMRYIHQGNLGVLKLVKQYGYHTLVSSSYRGKYLEEAVKAGNVRMVKWLIGEGFPMSPSIFSQALSRPNSSMAFVLMEYFSEWDDDMIVQAINGRLLRFLNVVLDKGFALTEEMIGAAAGNGDIVMVKMLRDKGCPWSVRTISSALRTNRFKIAKWLEKNGCPVK